MSEEDTSSLSTKMSSISIESRCSRLDGFNGVTTHDSAGQPRSSSTPIRQNSTGNGNLTTSNDEDHNGPTLAKQSLVSNASSNSMSEVSYYIIIINCCEIICLTEVS